MKALVTSMNISNEKICYCVFGPLIVLGLMDYSYDFLIKQLETQKLGIQIEKEVKISEIKERYFYQSIQILIEKDQFTEEKIELVEKIYNQS